jgi:two-component system, chemotaxis family, chemotaxis protein CheY
VKFLIVDDSSTMRRILVNSLQRIGYDEFVEAAGGTEGLEAFDESVAFVITDWNMPDMSGIEFARALRAHPEGHSVPVIMITTRAVRDDAVAVSEAGIAGCIVKPFTPQVLKERITAALRGPAIVTR